MKQILYYKLKACLKRYVFTRHLKLTESQGWIWEKKLKSTSSLHKIRYLTKEVLKFSSYEVYRKFIIRERRGTICSLRGRLKKGRGRGRVRGVREKNAKVSYPLSTVILLPFSLPPHPLPDSFVLKKNFFTKSAGSVFDWFGPFYHLSLVSLFPKRGRTKTAGDSSSSKNTLLRFIKPDEENIENLHCINKNTEIPIPVWKKRSQRDRFTREILHKKKDNEKLMLICTPSPNPQLPSPKLSIWTFPTRCPRNILNFRRVLRVVFTPYREKKRLEVIVWNSDYPRGRMVTDKREQGCQGFGHSVQPFWSQVCMWNKYFGASSA